MSTKIERLLYKKDSGLSIVLKYNAGSDLCRRDAAPDLGAVLNLLWNSSAGSSFIRKRQSDFEICTGIC